MEAGKQVEISLGSTLSLPLAAARQRASDIRIAIGQGKSLKEAAGKAEPAQAATIPTFGQFAESYIASVDSGWRNPVHRAQWRQSLRDHAARLTDLPITEVGTDDILAALQPIWLAKAETAKRVRGRIEKILDAAKARGIRPRDSTDPAAWRNHLALLLPAQSKLQRGHHTALPWKEAPAFMVELRAREALAARCLEFVILTAARSSEALGATWGEVDQATKLWTVPADRMKAGKKHVVPLSKAALELIKALSPPEPKSKDRIFSINGAVRSNMAMTMLLRRMKRGDLTTHGFRSTFRDWAGEVTDYPPELLEHALAHTIGSEIEKAYRRETAVERRRGIMQTLADYLDGTWTPTVVDEEKED